MEEAMKADTPKTYRLVELRAENVKKLKAVHIQIDGTMLQVAGRNGQGKSSLLDAVAMAIGGKEVFPEEPIRRGQNKAEIFLDFGGLKLTRRIWKKEGGKIEHDVAIEYADGKRPREKQHVLDELRGSPIADDPIAFSRLKPAERYDLLKKLVPDFDFEANAEERRTLFEDRTIVGRERDRAVAAAEATVVPPDARAELVDVTELAAALRAASDTNSTIDKRQQRREAAADELEAMRDRADQLAAELKALHEDIATREKQIAEAEALPEKIDTAELERQIANAETINAAARRRAERVAKDAEADRLTTKYESLSQQIAALDAAKAAAIEGAHLPVKELTFGDNDILLDGLPFSQASTARKIRVSTALLMALKPELRVLLVREGSLLDDEARAALEADAREHDFVVLMECVGAGDGSGIVIEDGEVV
jgi:energy-coupling factor transporter ATP-binding protein EcfA2